MGLAALLVLFAFARPLDHDESQYVAAAMLAWHGLPYRDFAYLQTPLQPLLFAPVAAALGGWVFPGLRLVNALLGLGTVLLVHRASRIAGAGPRAALIAAGLFAACDAFLFSAAVARNDMLPAGLYAGALCLMLGPPGRARSIGAGLLLAAATAAKLSYAIPALAFGAVALADRRYRPGWIVLGALPPALLVAVLWSLAPHAFLFEVLRFPTLAPEQFYAASGRAWKLAAWARALDTLKFLALGPALAALVLVARDRRRGRTIVLLDVLIVAGLFAAVMPAPTWRQYLLPLLPSLFVRLALVWERSTPGRAARAVLMLFVLAGLAPSAVALARAAAQGLPLVAAIRDGAALERASHDARVAGPIATLSPQFVPATGRPIDRRFAAGPFYFRSMGLLSSGEEKELDLVSRARLSSAFAATPPAAILVGGEGKWTSGDAALDAVLQRYAQDHGWPGRRVGRFRLYVRPDQAATVSPAQPLFPATSAS